MKGLISKLKNKKIMVISLSTFVLIVVVTIAVVNYSFGFRVSNQDNQGETFPLGYVLSKNDCVDATNNVVPNATKYDGDTMTVEPGQTVFCHLEFEVPGSSLILYDPSKSNAHSTLGEECHNVQCALDRLYILYKDNENDKGE